MNLRPKGIYADAKYRCSTLVGLAVPEQQSGLILSRQRISDDKRARVQTIPESSATLKLGALPWEISK